VKITDRHTPLDGLAVYLLVHFALFACIVGEDVATNTPRIPGFELGSNQSLHADPPTLVQNT
jgi:hypothetical protein